MTRKRSYCYDLSEEQSAQIERIEVFACEKYSSYSVNIYFRDNSSDDTFTLFCLLKDAIKSSVSNMCKDTTNKTPPRSAEHYEQAHVLHSKTHLAHMHIYFDLPTTLTDLAQCFNGLYDECKAMDDRFKGITPAVLLGVASVLDPITTYYVKHCILHADLQEGEFFLKKSAVQQFISSYEKHLQQELFRACALGNEEDIRYLLHLGVSVNCQDEAGRTPLHCAVMRNELVSKYDPTIDIATSMANHPAVVRMLLCDYDADPQIQNHRGNTMRSLIDREKASADPLDRETALAIEKSLEAALFQACALGNVKQIKTLLDLGVSVNCQDELGRTPLHYAVMRAELIQEKYAAQMQEANISIQEAMSNHPYIVKMLLVEYGADGRISNTNKKTPFDLILRDRNVADRLTQQTAQAIFAALPVAVAPRASLPAQSEVSRDSLPTPPEAARLRGNSIRHRYWERASLFSQHNSVVGGLDVTLARS